MIVAGDDCGADIRNATARTRMAFGHTCDSNGHGSRVCHICDNADSIAVLLTAAPDFRIRRDRFMVMTTRARASRDHLV